RCPASRRSDFSCRSSRRRVRPPSSSGRPRRRHPCRSPRPTTAEMADDTLTASVSVLLDEHARVQEELSDPAVHADAGRAKKLTRRYAELEKVAAASRHFAELESDHAAAVELAEDD